MNALLDHTCLVKARLEHTIPAPVYDPASLIALDGYVCGENTAHRPNPTTLARFCPQAPGGPEMSAYHAREVWSLGTWHDPENVWTVQLAIMGAARHLFAGYLEPELTAFITSTLEGPLPATRRLKTTAAVYATAPPGYAPSGRTVVQGGEVALGMAAHVYEQDNPTLACRLDIRLWRAVLQAWKASTPTLPLLLRVRLLTDVQLVAPVVRRGHRALGIAELVLIIGQFLNIPDLVALRHTCAFFHSVLDGVDERRLGATLSPFFPKTKALRQRLWEDHALLTGCAPLKVLVGGDWTPSDLAFLVPRRFSGRLIEFFTQSGYAINLASRRQGDCRSMPSLRYETFKMEGGGRSLDVTVVDAGARRLAAMLLDASTSMMMSAFDGHRLICMSPRLTFAGKYVVNRHFRPALVQLDAVAARGLEREADQTTGALERWLGSTSRLDLEGFLNEALIWSRRIAGL